MRIRLRIRMMCGTLLGVTGNTQHTVTGAIATLPTTHGPAYAVEVRRLGKVFGSTVACADVSFGVHAGEVLALVGENGAGKSTCVKMLGGVYQPDAGEVLVNDLVVDLDNPITARNLGISVVHQQPELFGELTVAENVFAGDLRTKGPWVDQKGMQTEARELLASLGLDFDVKVTLDSLRISEQQLVEIARALAAKARVLILDEPTAALTSTEVTRLFEIVDRLRKDGVAIVFVGHRLEEILRISDRITVLRDGRVVGTTATGDTDRSGLVTMMVGRELDSAAVRTPYPPGDKVLATTHLSVHGNFTDVSVSVRAGEVVGLAGLVGSGRTEFARALFGIDKVTSGTIEMFGHEVTIPSPQAALSLGIAYVAEDRRGQSIVEDFTILDNATLPVLSEVATAGLVRRSKAIAAVSAPLQRMKLKFASLDQPIRTLSGGNQQKVVLAKWLATHPKLLIVDEPTQGVDIGAKAEVHRIVDELAGSGIAILMISSDMPELIATCDRVYVMNHGHVVEELPHEELDAMAIGRAATEPRFATAQDTDDATPARGPSWAARLAGGVVGRPELALAAAILALIIPLSLLNLNFYNTSNLADIGDYSALIGLVCLGEMLVILTRNIDLSVASVIGLSAYCAAWAMREIDGAPVVLGLGVGIGAGVACGLFNGLCVAYGRVPSIVVTLGTLAVFRGLLSELSSGDRVKPTDVSAAWLAFSKDSLGPISLVVAVAIVAFTIVGLLLTRTRQGREIYFVGSNPAGARLLGMPARRRICGAFVASGLLAGTAGAIWASYYPYVDGQVAFGLEAAVIAAVVVGGVALRGGHGTVLGVAVGVLGLFALRKVLVVGGLPDQYLLAVYGAAIIVAVTVDTLLARRRSANGRRIV